MSKHREHMIKWGGVALVLCIVMRLFQGVAAVYCACVVGWIVCFVAWLYHFVKYWRE